jgi:hypothetical protein
MDAHRQGNNPSDATNNLKGKLFATGAMKVLATLESAFSGARLVLEEQMEFVICPSCKEGRLLPFSGSDGPFNFWVCSAPSCTYVVSSSLIEVMYYKGAAAAKVVEKDGKGYTEFKF